MPFAGVGVVRAVMDAFEIAGVGVTRAAAVASAVHEAVSRKLRDRLPSALEVREAVVGELELMGFPEVAGIVRWRARTAAEARAALFLDTPDGPGEWNPAVLAAVLAEKFDLPSTDAAALADLVEERLLRGSFSLVTPALLEEIARAEMRRMEREAGRPARSPSPSPSPFAPEGSEWERVVFDASAAGHSDPLRLAGEVADLAEGGRRVVVTGLERFTSARGQAGLMEMFASALSRACLRSLRLCLPLPDVREAARIAELPETGFRALPEPAWVVPPGRAADSRRVLEVLVPLAGRMRLAFLSAFPPPSREGPPVVLSLPPLMFGGDDPPAALRGAVLYAAELAPEEGGRLAAAGLCEAVEFLEGSLPHESRSSLERAAELVRELGRTLAEAEEIGPRLSLTLDLDPFLRRAAAARDAAAFPLAEALCTGGTYLSPVAEKEGEAGRRSARLLASLTGDEVVSRPVLPDRIAEIVRFLDRPGGAAGIRFEPEEG